ncbi:MAG: tetratricopeptide repeat protein [Candidatus Binatia bacterium]
MHEEQVVKPHSRELFGWIGVSALAVLSVPILFEACTPTRTSRLSLPSSRIRSTSRSQEPLLKPIPQPHDSSLVAKISPQTSPQRAASLRLAEEGKRLMKSGQYERALVRLEKTISIDSTNPYGYYYLAETHYRMGRYRQSLNFLDVAESLLASKPYWLAEVYALKGENFRALGLPRQAELNYSHALRLNPRNRVASRGLSRVRGGSR